MYCNCKPDVNQIQQGCCQESTYIYNKLYNYTCTVITIQLTGDTTSKNTHRLFFFVDSYDQVSDSKVKTEPLNKAARKRRDSISSGINAGSEGRPIIF